MRISDWSSDVCSSDLELGTDGAQALLMQTMFVAYLEDREIIGEAVFRDASQGRFVKLLELLEAGDTATFETLFTWLHGAFNGNLFKAPCAFEADSAHPPKVQPKHLSVLARRSEEHTSELQSLMRNSYAVFCLKKKITITTQQ